MSFWVGVIVGIVTGQVILCLYGMLMLSGAMVITYNDEDDND